MGRGSEEAMKRDIRRGDVWWCELPDAGSRPVVVLSRNAAIHKLRRAMVAPCTSVIRDIPTEVLLDPQHEPIPRVCVVNTDTVETVSVGHLTSRLGSLSRDRMRAICGALALATDCTA